MVFDFLFFYYKNISKFTCKRFPFHLIILCAEYLPLFGISVLCLQHLVNLVAQTELTFQTDFYQYIIYVYSFGFFALDTHSINQNNYLVFIPLLLYIVFIVELVLLLFCYKKNKSKKKNEKLFKGTVLKKIFFTFLDVFFFRFFNIYLCEFIIYTLAFEYGQSEQIVQYFALFFKFLFLILHIFTCLLYYNTFHIIVKLNENDFNYPYDTYSCLYDKFLFILKVLSSFWFVLYTRKEGILVFFFSLVIVLCILFYGLYMLFSITEMISNKRTNHIRMSLLIFNSLYLILYALFGRFYSIPITIAVWIGLIALTILFLYITDNYFIHSLTQNKGLLEKAIYLIEEMMQSDQNCSMLNSNKNNYQRVITTMIISHEIKCLNDNCPLCAFDLTFVKNDSQSKKKLLQILYKLIKVSPNESKAKLFDLLQIIIRVGCVSNNNHFTTNFYFYQLLKKYSNTSDTAMTLNLSLLHHSYLRKHSADKKKAMIMMDIISLNTKVKDLIKEYKELLFVKEHSPFSLVSSSLKLKRSKYSITSYNNKKYEFDQNYNVVLIWFIIETIFNSKIKNKDGVCFDLSLYEDTLTENFVKYNYMILHHQLGTNCFKIHNAGKEFAKFVNKNFEGLFFKDMQKEVIKELLSYFQLNKSNSKNPFEFPIIDWAQNKFIQSFRIRFFALPSIECKDLLINGIYKVDYEDLIVFVLDKHDSSLWNLHLYSRKLEKELFVSIEALNELHQNQKYIDLFTLLTPSKDLNFHHQLFEINYPKYYKKLVSYYKYDAKKGDLENLRSTYKPIIMKHKTIIKGVNQTYRIFATHLTKIVPDNNIYQIKDSTLLYKTPDDQEDEDNFNDDFFMNGTVVSTLASSAYMNSKSSISRSINQSRYGLSKEKITEKEIQREKKRKIAKSFTGFTKVLCFFNLFLFVFSCLFLFSDIFTTEQFSKAFLIESKLLSMELNFVNSNLNIFSILCLGITDDENCTASMEMYSKNLFPNGEFNLRDYLFNELTPKADKFKETSTEFKRYVNNYHNTEMLSILETPMHFFFVSMNETIITAKMEEIKFVDAILRYSNMLNMLINNKARLNEPILIFNITGDRILFNQTLINAASQYQITMYEFILNYISYIKIFNQLKEVTYSDVTNSFTVNKFIIICFPVALIGLHLILYAMCLHFIQKFEAIIEAHIQEIMANITEDATKEYFFNKIKLVKALSKLLVENPMDVIKQIGSLKSKYKMRFEGKEPTATTSSSTPYLSHLNQTTKTYFALKDYHKVTIHDKIAISLIFFICIIYLLCYLFIAREMVNQFLNAANYISYSSGITSALCSSIGILSMVLLTTRTDKELNEILTGVKGKSYIERQISTVHYNLNYIIFFRSQKYPYAAKIEDHVELNCDTMYPEFNDMVINSAIKTEKDLEYLAFICNNFKFMKFKNEHILIYEIGLQLHQLYQEINIKDIEGMYEIAHSVDYYGLMTIILLIFRPIRIYCMNYFYQEAIYIVTSDNTMVSVIILVINIVMEITIYLLIKFGLINSLLEKNKSLSVLNKCVKQ